MGPVQKNQSTSDIALSLIASTCWSVALAGPATVLSVGDEDTLTVNDSDRKITIRLACIDAPESAQWPYGSQSRAALQALGRLLGHVDGLQHHGHAGRLQVGRRGLP